MSDRLTRLAAATGLTLTVASSGCATFLSDSTYRTRITSDPQGASFAVRDAEGETVASGQTPQVVPLKARRTWGRPAQYTVEMHHPVGGSQRLPVKAGVDPWTFANLIIGGVPGFVVDLASGAAYELPESVNANFNGQMVSETSPPPGVVPASHSE